MKCKKHPLDLSHGIGVCATCLSERLSDLIAAQELYSAGKDRRKVDPIQEPVIFPRSVSPYVGVRDRRKNETDDRRFFSTPQPQIGLTARPREKKPSKFAIISKIFRHKSKKSESNNASCSSNSNWFSQIFSRPRKTELRFAPGERRPNRIIDRGMSPEMTSSDRSIETSPKNHRREVSSAPVTTIQKKPTRGGHVRNGSGLAFYMSPLVRASPTRDWNRKGLSSEIGLCGEIRVPAKPNMFRTNRSKKIADFGRVGYNR